jgi:hypothetical protein
MRWGADVVVHSATKYIGGHGTTMGGVIVESGKFNWATASSPKFTSPSPGYHGVIFPETFGDFGYTMKARMGDHAHIRPGALADERVAAAPGPGIASRTDGPPLREYARRRQVPAGASAGRLGNYPGLPDNKYHALARKYLPKGASGLLNFGVKGGAKAGERFIEAAQFMSHLANIGDAKTLIIHPASTTHRQMEEADLIKAGVTPDMVRLSVGIETLDDILWTSTRHSRHRRKHDQLPGDRARASRCRRCSPGTPKPPRQRSARACDARGVCHSDPPHLGWILRPRRRQALLRQGARLCSAFHHGARATGRRRSAGTQSQGGQGRAEAPGLPVDRLRQVRRLQGRPGKPLRLRHAHSSA